MPEFNWDDHFGLILRPLKTFSEHRRRKIVPSLRPRQLEKISSVLSIH